MGHDGEKIPRIEGVKGKNSLKAIRKRRAKARNKGKKRRMRNPNAR